MLSNFVCTWISMITSASIPAMTRVFLLWLLQLRKLQSIRKLASVWQLLVLAIFCQTFVQKFTRKGFFYTSDWLVLSSVLLYFQEIRCDPVVSWLFLIHCKSTLSWFLCKNWFFATLKMEKGFCPSWHELFPCFCALQKS